MAAPAGLKALAPPPQELRLCVWIDEAGAWHARAEFGDGRPRAFDSPFELARFVSRLPWPVTPPDPHGLR